MVQIVFQNPYDTFTSKDTIGEILIRPLKIHGIGANKDERREICLEALKKGGLNPAEEFMKRYPHQLSGGQLQRISIIRSMLLEPEFIIADEPVSMLDVSVRADIVNMLLDLKKNNGTTIVFISHDISLTRYISDEIAVMYLGRVVETGKVEDIINFPKHPYTQVLISNCQTIDPEDSTEPIKITGEPPTPIDPPDECYFAPSCIYAMDICKKKYPEMVNTGNGHLVSCHKIIGGEKE